MRVDSRVRVNERRGFTKTGGITAHGSHAGVSSAPADMAGLEHALRAAGHRLSTSRRRLLEALCAAALPVTAEEIAIGLAGDTRSSDVSSIYRNLELLEREGLVYHLHLGRGPRRYRLVGGDDACYLVCAHCERVDAVASSDLDDARAAVLARLGYRPSFMRFPVVGLCGDCAATGVAEEL